MERWFTECGKQKAVCYLFSYEESTDPVFQENIKLEFKKMREDGYMVVTSSSTIKEKPKTADIIQAYKNIIETYEVMHPPEIKLPYQKQETAKKETQMSQEYIFFTEIEHEGQWVCINNYVTRMHPIEHLVLIPTYEYHSRTLFQSAYDKLEEDGSYLKEDALSEELKRKIYDHIRDFEYGMICVDYEKIKSYLNRKTKEHCAFALRSAVASFESGEDDDVSDYVTAAQYIEMDDELKKAYQYYEWNDRDGVFRHYDAISKTVEQQLEYWERINPVAEKPNVRIWMFIH